MFIKIYGGRSRPQSKETGNFKIAAKSDIFRIPQYLLRNKKDLKIDKLSS
jgi:hypothetical protein